jgi:hypothetical protein
MIAAPADMIRNDGDQALGAFAPATATTAINAIATLLEGLDDDTAILALSVPPQISEEP